jgi:glucan 1,3-beta-glucosidase
VSLYIARKSKCTDILVVGNEYLLNTAGTSSLVSATYLSAVKTIADHVQEVNSTILGMNLSKHLPIGTSDAGSLLSTTLATGIDFFMANVHPWFATVEASVAAVWTDQFFQNFDVVSDRNNQIGAVS